MTWVRSALFNLAFFSWTALACLTALPVVILFMKRDAVHGLARFWSRVNFVLLRVLCRIDHEIVGRENLPEGPCILASKHQSAWDTMVFHHILDRPCFVLKRELLGIPLFGRALSRTQMLAIDRAGGAKALKTMVAEARDRLAEGRRIVIFPEGTRVAPGDHRRHLPGVAALYQALDVPVVPVALNSGLFWARRSFRKKPGRIRLEILPPIAPGLARKAFTAKLEDRIEGATRALIAAPAALAGLDGSVDSPVDNSGVR